MTRQQLELLRSLIRAEIDMRAEKEKNQLVLGEPLWLNESSAYAEAVFESLVKSFNEHEADPR